MQDNSDIRRRECELFEELYGWHEKVEALLEIMGIDHNATLAHIRAAIGVLAAAQMDGGS